MSDDFIQSLLKKAVFCLIYSFSCTAFSAFGMWSPNQAETFNPWAEGIIFVLVIKELIVFLLDRSTYPS